jgi:hypothetical protein
MPWLSGVARGVWNVGRSIPVSVMVVGVVSAAGGTDNTNPDGCISDPPWIPIVALTFEWSTAPVGASLVTASDPASAPGAPLFEVEQLPQSTTPAMNSTSKMGTRTSTSLRRRGVGTE